MISSADQETLRDLVGPSTFARGRDYALRGAVKSHRWGKSGLEVAGEVQGAAYEPYRASVQLTRSASKQLSALVATCTCPVTFNCKHAVALLLAEDVSSQPSPARPASSPGPVPDVPGRDVAQGRDVARALHLVDGDGSSASAPTRRRSTRQDPTLADWERPLRALLIGDGARNDSEWSEIGLQLELVAARSRPGSRAIGPGIKVRPVVPSRSGRWVRTGISWSSLEYFQLGRSASGATRDRLFVVKELQALSRATRLRSAYSYGEEAIWLEAINSRRLWDLLRQARDLQVPLVVAGRQALTVTLGSSAAHVAIDVTRAGTDILVRPRIDVADEQVPLESSLLLGDPAHGIAWWDIPPGSPGAPRRLCLAPLAAPLDDSVRAFLVAEPVAVPQRSEDRFLRDFYPVLRRRVAVRSSDRSVELPGIDPTRLVLSIRHDDGHRIDLGWAWAGTGAEGPVALWALRRGAYDRLDEDRIVAAVMGVLGAAPGLVELTPYGERLASRAALEGMAAVRFLTEIVPALLRIDGVEIDRSGPEPDYREADEVPVVHLDGRESRDDWFDLTVSVTVGGEEVPFHELFVALAEERSHLILPSGTYFSLQRDELRQLANLISEARALQDSAGDGIRLSRFQAGLWEDLQRLGVVTAQASQWQASVRALNEARDRTDHAVPESLRATLRPYQREGFNWLAYLYEHRLGGILADDMGLGKTLQALALVCHTREQGLTAAPYLVVAPTSVVQNWASECRRFAPGLTSVTITETTGRRRMPLDELAAGADIVITSYALFRIEYDHYEAVDWAGLFLDEAQFAKNRNSQAYRRAKMLPLPFKVAMTGTPMENNLMELWSLLSISAPGLFASPDQFDEHYRVPIEKHSDEERLDKLRRRIRPLMLRRTKQQVADDLPDKQEQVLELDLSSKHKKLYQTYLQRERQKVLGLLGDMSKHRFEIFRSLTLLRQASLDVSLVDVAHAGTPSTKLDALMVMLRDVVADGHRVLVFSQFTRFLTLARQRISAEGIEHCYLDGRTRRRAEVIESFRNGEAPVFLISLKAGGFGLNLAEADYCILLDPWWNPATEAQAVDRIHRIGQTRKVMVYRLVAKDTIEEKVMALKARKAALFANVVDGGGFESGALTAADIRSLLADDAVTTVAPSG